MQGGIESKKRDKKYSGIAWVCCEPLTQTYNDCLGRMIRAPMKEKRPYRPMGLFRLADPGEGSSFFNSLVYDSQNPAMAWYRLNTSLFSVSIVSPLPCLLGPFSFLCCPQLQERDLGLVRG